MQHRCGGRDCKDEGHHDGRPIDGDWMELLEIIPSPAKVRAKAIPTEGSENSPSLPVVPFPHSGPSPSEYQTPAVAPSLQISVEERHLASRVSGSEPKIEM
jgi:hypothetical protein